MTSPTSDERHAKTLLSNLDFTGPAGDIRLYADVCPSSMRNAVLSYASNVESAEHLYAYPLKIYVLWLADRATREGMSEGDMRDKLAPLFMDFVENHSTGPARESLKASAYAHATNMYVVLWSVYEAFIRDFLRATFNEFPALLKDKADGFKKKPADTKLGDYVTGRKYTLSSVIELLLETKIIDPSDSRLGAALKSNWLVTLEKRRHIVAHRAGIIDAEYREATRQGVIGERVPVSPYEIKGCFSGVHNAAFNLLAEVTRYITLTPK